MRAESTTMEAIDELQKLLPSVPVVQNLGGDFPGIDSKPGVCGGDPCIVSTRIPIWLLEQYRRLGMPEQEMLDSYPSLRAEDLANAWAYSRVHALDIDEQIRANE